MNKEPQFTLRWHKERLPVIAGMMICVIVEFLAIVGGVTMRNSLFIWLVLVAALAAVVLGMVILPLVIRKEKKRQASR